MNKYMLSTTLIFLASFVLVNAVSGQDSFAIIENASYAVCDGDTDIDLH